jgi:proteasome lid subunit RPN8/RPN11
MLKLRQAEFDAIRRHGEETYPEECCGILLGRTQGGSLEKQTKVEALIRCRNAHPSPKTRYEIDPAEAIRAQREARERGLEIVGFYHSHPDHPAEWSPTDLADAHWIGCSYVITSVDGGKATLTRSFALIGTTEEDKALVEEDWEVS